MFGKRNHKGWIICFLAMAGVLQAKERPEVSPWEVTGAAGFALADGNSDSLAYSVQLLTTYVKDGNEAYLGLDHFYAENNGLQSTDSLKLTGQFNRDLNDKWYLSSYNSALRDNVADIDYRADTSALLGYRAIRNDRMKLSFEAGPGYAWEKQGDLSDDFMTLRFSQRYEYKFAEASKFWQSISWTPRADDLSESLIEFDAGIETRLTEKVAARTFLRHRIDSSPAVGSGEEDTALMLGLSYDLGGVAAPKKASGGRKSLMKVSSSAPASSSDGWETTAALGFSLNKGNSDKLGLNMDWDTEFKSDEREFAYELDYNYSEDNGIASTDRVTSRVQYNRYVTDRSYLGSAIGFLRDDLSEIDYRLTPGVLAGYSVIKANATQLKFEAGPTMTFEKTGDGSDEFASVMVAERFKHRFSDRYSLKQSLVSTAEIEDAENYTVVGAVSFDTKLSDQLIWRVGTEYHYENEPATGREQDDLLVTSSIAIKF